MNRKDKIQKIKDFLSKKQRSNFGYIEIGVGNRVGCINWKTYNVYPLSKIEASKVTNKTLVLPANQYENLLDVKRNFSEMFNELK